MMWADSYWLFIDDKETLVCMVSNIIEELLDLVVEPKRESSWTYKDEDVATLKVRRGEKTWDMPLMEVGLSCSKRWERDTIRRGLGKLVV